MKLEKIKWIDKEGPSNDGYLGWGWQLNIGKINLGWLPAFEGDVFQFAVHTVDWDCFTGQDKYTIDECMNKVEELLDEVG